MILYSYDDYNTDTVKYTWDRKLAYAQVDKEGGDVYKIKLKKLPLEDLIVRLLNQDDFAESSVLVRRRVVEWIDTEFDGEVQIVRKGWIP